MKLKLTPAAYEAAKRQGIIRRGAEFLPGWNTHKGPKSQYLSLPEITAEYWMKGSIAPCEIEIVK